MQTICADICLGVRLWHLHRRRQPFHPLSNFLVPLKVHYSIGAVSFLFWSYASQHPAFQQVAFSKLLTEFRMSGPSSEIKLISVFANSIAISEASCPTHKNEGRKRVFKPAVQIASLHLRVFSNEASRRKISEKYNLNWGY